MRKLFSGPGGVFLAALAARLLMLAFGPTPTHDDGTYENAVLSYFSGQGLSYPAPFNDWPIRYQSWLPPGFPAVLIVFYKIAGVGADKFPLQIAIMLLCSAACVALYHIGRDTGSKALGLLAGYALALYPPHAMDSMSINPHPIAGALVVFCLWGVVRAGKRGSWPAAAAAGACLGAAVLTRGEFFSVGPWIALWLVAGTVPIREWMRDRRALTVNLSRRLLVAGAFIAGIVAVMSPWWIRNYRIHDRFVPISTNYGDNFYFAFNPMYRFSGHATYYRPERLREICEGKSETECADEFVREGWRYMEGKPLRMARLLTGNFLHFWRPYLSTERYSFAQSAAYAAVYLPIFILFLMGLGMVPWKDEASWVLVGGVIAVKLLGHLPFYIIVRFRESIMPAIILFAAFAALEFWRRREYPKPHA